MADNTQDGVQEQNVDGVDNSSQEQQQRESEKQYSESFVKRLLSEKKATQAKLREFEQQQKQREEQQLLEENKIKELLERREDELSQTQSKLNQTQDFILNATRLNAFRKATGGKLKDQYSHFLDLSNIEVDPETMSVNEDTVKQTVDNYMQNYPDFFKSVDNKPKSPTEVPNVSDNNKSGFDVNNIDWSEVARALGR